MPYVLDRGNDVQSYPWEFAMVLGVILLVATITDLRSREVPLWLTSVGLVSGLLVAALHGASTLNASLLGLAVGVLPTLPFLLLGGLGGADILLLAMIGAWEGWRFVLLAEWWTAVAGAGLAFIAWRRGQERFAYVPALLIGTVIATVAA